MVQRTRTAGGGRWARLELSSSPTDGLRQRQSAQRLGVLVLFRSVGLLPVCNAMQYGMADGSRRAESTSCLTRRLPQPPGDGFTPSCGSTHAATRLSTSRHSVPPFRRWPPTLFRGKTIRQRRRALRPRATRERSVPSGKFRASAASSYRIVYGDEHEADLCWLGTRQRRGRDRELPDACPDPARSIDRDSWRKLSFARRAAHLADVLMMHDREEQARRSVPGRHR